MGTRVTVPGLRYQGSVPRYQGYGTRIRYPDTVSDYGTMITVLWYLGTVPGYGTLIWYQGSVLGYLGYGNRAPGYQGKVQGILYHVENRNTGITVGLGRGGVDTVPSRRTSEASVVDGRHSSGSDPEMRWGYGRVPRTPSGPRWIRAGSPTYLDVDVGVAREEGRDEGATALEEGERSKWRRGRSERLLWGRGREIEYDNAK